MVKARKHVMIYTDGACSGNPGPGGYGTILVYDGVEKELSAGYRLTTNNRMELRAVIAGLEALRESCDVTVCSDSRYIVDAMEKGWARKWESQGWMRTKKDPALNPDLWSRLLDLCDEHRVKFLWTRGHSGHVYNERCDALAVKAGQTEPLMEDRRSMV